jgi:methionyl aminopeptidase
MWLSRGRVEETEVRVIALKTPQEIEAMRPAGRVVASILGEVRRNAAVGVRLDALDQVAREVLRDAGAVSPFLHYQPRGAPRPYPAAICTSVNDAVLHGIPTSYRLRDGDLLSIDCGAKLDGWVADAATSLTVGQSVPADERMIEVAGQALTAGIAQARVGNRLGDISSAIGERARANGYGLNTDYGGHGVGHEMHEQPSVPNEGKAGKGMRLAAGLVIAIEPWFMAGGRDDYVVDDDGWTVLSGDGSRTVHVEHTVAVTDDGPVVLTAADA